MRTNILLFRGKISTLCTQSRFYMFQNTIIFVSSHWKRHKKRQKGVFLLPRCSRSLLTNHYSLLTINYSLLYWLQENFSSVRNIILIGEKLNSHWWENEFPSMGNRIPIGGTIVSHQWEFQFKPISCDRSTSWFVKISCSAVSCSACSVGLQIRLSRFV